MFKVSVIFLSTCPFARRFRFHDSGDDGVAFSEIFGGQINLADRAVTMLLCPREFDFAALVSLMALVRPRDGSVSDSISRARAPFRFYRRLIMSGVAITRRKRSSLP